MRRFTLNELLIIGAILCLAAALAIPAFAKIYASTKSTICQDRLLLIAKANILYAADNRRYAPAAPSDSIRWHGVRDGKGFAPEKGPLHKYISKGGKIEDCPLVKDLMGSPSPLSREPGGWGYGYNENIGSLRYTETNADYWSPAVKALGLEPKTIKKPSSTAMFTETATLVDEKGETYIHGKLAEYAFCHSFSLVNRGKDAWASQEPTIHFRHQNRANAVWIDGHLSKELMRFSKDGWSQERLGFFGPQDNSLFDPY